MRDSLAERLLAEVMKWTPENVAVERPTLQALATFKYDEYQQFSPGMRFVESLALWLSQFKSDGERKQAYEFIRSRLIFISDAEMAHLVSITYPDYILPILIRQTASQLRLPERVVKKVTKTKEFRILLRQSLFLGLSDGAHIDLFRRNNPQISHEQVWQTYEISEAKAEDMLSKLDSDLERFLDRKPTVDEKRFRVIFLLDDFSGSGLSYLRNEPDSSQYAGKIHNVLNKLSDEKGVLNNLIDLDDLHICVILYIVTTQAASHLQSLIQKWLKENGRNYKCTMLPIQTLPSTIQLHPEKDGQFLCMLEKYFDDSIIDEHYQKGRCQIPHLGFDQCALPIILSHNTPNNSVPLLWFDEYRKYRGLFPRVSRHKGKP